MVNNQVFGGVSKIACALILLLDSQLWTSADSTSYTRPRIGIAAPASWNGQVQFTLDGEYGVGYVIESSPDLWNWTPAVTNRELANTRLLTLPAPNNSCFYRALRLSTPLFRFAVAARNDIAMNGSGILTDSWNSHDPNLSTNGQYDPAKTSTNGSIASVQGSVQLGNHTVKGDLYLAPAASYQNDGTITGTIYSDYNLQLPDVELPTPPGGFQSGPPSSGSGGTLTHDFTSAYNDTYWQINDSGTIILEPGIKVTLLVTSVRFSPTSIIIRGGTTNSGTLAVYQVAGSATLSGNAAAPVGRPENFFTLVCLA
jgi:hypothetical protein